MLTALFSASLFHTQTVWLCYWFLCWLKGTSAEDQFQPSILLQCVNTGHQCPDKLQQSQLVTDRVKRISVGAESYSDYFFVVTDNLLHWSDNYVWNFPASKFPVHFHSTRKKRRMKWRKEVNEAFWVSSALKQEANRTFISVHVELIQLSGWQREQLLCCGSAYFVFVDEKDKNNITLKCTLFLSAAKKLCFKSEVPAE